MKDAAPRDHEDYWLYFDARVRGLARRLADAGFSPLVDIEDDDEPRVFLSCSPENLIVAADRLHAIVTTWHIPAYNADHADARAETCGVAAVYYPSEHNAVLIVWGIDDQMLSQCPEPVSMTRSIVAAASQLTSREGEIAAPVRHTPEAVLENFDPSCHAVVRHFMEAGFPVMEAEPTENDCTNLSLWCMPEQLVSEARSLHARVRSWGVPEVRPAPEVSASYLPNLQQAFVALSGIENSMLAEISS